MLWTMVVAAGLVAELWVIIGLGRQVTRRYEAEDEPAAGASSVVREVPAPETLVPNTAAPHRAA